MTHGKLKSVKNEVELGIFISSNEVVMYWALGVWLKAYIITDGIMSFRAHTHEISLNHEPWVPDKCLQHEFLTLHENYAAHSNEISLNHEPWVPDKCPQHEFRTLHENYASQWTTAALEIFFRIVVKKLKLHEI